MIQFLELNYKKIALFLVFFIFVFISPFVFAQDSNEPIASTEMSNSSFMRFKDLHMNFRNWDDIEKVNTVLGPNSVIQFPAGVTVYNQNGIDFNATIEQWIRKSQEDPKYSEFRPLYRNCPNGEEECPGVDTFEIYLPVKVVKASDPNYDVNGRQSYGYIALDYIKRKVAQNRYQTVRTNLTEALKITDESNDGEKVISGGEETAGDSDATSPRAREVVQRIETDLNRKIYNCDNTRYRRTGYEANSCLTRMGYNLRQKAELVMKDVLEISRLRTPPFKIDPRFSACMAYRESRFSPNAVGGSPDWGMYQIINGTAREALRYHNPVIPEFQKYRNRWDDYRTQMLRSTLAQADLHHSVLYRKATYGNFVSKVNNMSMSDQDYRELAARYNGSSHKATYARAIVNCFVAMRKVADRNGNVTGSESSLRAALNKAL